MKVSGQLHDPGALNPGKNPGTNRTGSWVRLRSPWTFGEDKNLLPLLGFKTRFGQFVAILIMLHLEILRLSVCHDYIFRSQAEA